MNRSLVRPGPRGWLLMLAVAVGACSAQSKDSTGGKRIVLGSRVAVAPRLGTELTTGTGWRVKLDSAQLAIGALYYFDGKPAFASNQRRSPLERLQSVFVGTAYAHPQHYVAGNALGEMVEPSSVDLSRDALLPNGDGVTGTYRSGRLVFPERIEGPAAASLRGQVATARGSARRDAQTVYFTVSTGLTDIREVSPAGEVDGCVLDEVDVTGNGTITLTVTPSVWFDFVDFSTVDPGREDAPTDIARGNVAHRGFTLGVAQLSAYHFHYQP